MKLQCVLDMRTWPEWARLAGFAAVYGALVLLGHFFIVKPGFYPVCWPVAGFLLGVLLLVPTCRWWRWLAVAAPVSLLVDGLMGVSWWAAAGYWLANVVGGGVGAGLIRWQVAPQPRLHSVREMLGVVGLGGGIGVAVGGAVGSLFLATRCQVSVLDAWLAQMAGGSLGVLAAAPVVLVAGEALDRLFRIKRRQWGEVAFTLLGVGGTVWLVFGWLPDADLSQVYFLLPIVIVAVLRLGLPGSALTGSLLTLLILGLIRLHVGQGMIVDGMIIPYLITIQSFLLMTLFSVLLLGVVLKERQLAQAAVREQEQRLRLVLDATSDGVWDRNLLTDQAYYSPHWAGMLGYAPEEVEPTGEFWRKLIHPADASQVRDVLERHLRRETPTYRYEFRLRRKDGAWQWVLARGRVVAWDERGRPVRILGTHTDISEQKAVEEAMRRRDRILEAAAVVGDVLLRSADSQRALRESMAKLGQGLDLCRVYVLANQRGADGRLCMCLRHEWVRPGTPAGTITDLPYDELEASEQIGILAARGVVYGRTDTFPVKWQERLRARSVEGVVLAPVFVDRQWWGVLGFDECRRARTWLAVEVETLKIVAELFGAMFQRQRDEQLLREREEESRRLEERLQQMQRLDSLSSMAGGIAHDFNNLLMVMLGNADMLRRQAPVKSAECHMLDEIETAGQRAAELCRQMLAFSGHSQAQLQPVDINRLASETAGLLEVLVPSSSAFDCRLGEDACWVRGDPVQLRQVLVNLVTNAVEALEARSGLVRIATGREWVGRSQLRETLLGEELAEGWYGVLDVEDTGCGMDAVTQSRIFNPFFSTKFTGRGLGLPAVFGIVRGHHGAIRLHSETGKGTWIRVYLPESPVASAEAVVPGGRAGGAGVPADPPPPTGVLVADDEPGVRLYLRHLLEPEGFMVIEAGDGREAVQRFARHPAAFAAVVLDAEMPVLGGAEAARQILALRPELAVVLVSGYFLAADGAAVTPGHGEPVRLHKPFQREHLLAAIGVRISARG